MDGTLTGTKTPGQSNGNNPYGIVVNAQNCDVVVREFELQSSYYAHFWTNALWEDMNPFILLQQWVK